MRKANNEPVFAGQSTTRRPVALIDMDGTLCDCGGALSVALERLRGPQEDPLIERQGELPAHIEERRKLIMGTPGFWRALMPLRLGFQLFELLKSLQFDVYILTKGPSRHSLGWMEKVDWCRQHVPELPVIVTDDKTPVWGDVLVEDWPPYIAQWLAVWPQGTVIAPAQTWNEDVQERFPMKCIRFDGRNEGVLRDRLEIIASRLAASNLQLGPEVRL